MWLTGFYVFLFIKPTFKVSSPKLKMFYVCLWSNHIGLVIRSEVLLMPKHSKTFLCTTNTEIFPFFHDLQVCFYKSGPDSPGHWEEKAISECCLPFPHVLILRSESHLGLNYTTHGPKNGLGTKLLLHEDNPLSAFFKVQSIRDVHFFSAFSPSLLDCDRIAASVCVCADSV